MSHRIRLAEPEEYPAIVEVLNSAYPADEDKTEPAQMHFWDECLEPKYKSRRFVLEVDGRIAAYAHNRIPVDIYHAEKFYMTLAVHPDHQNRGLGTALYQHIISLLQEDGLLAIRDATPTRPDAREDGRLLAPRELDLVGGAAGLAPRTEGAPALRDDLARDDELFDHFV